MKLYIVVTVSGLSSTDSGEAITEELHNLIADWAAGCVPQPLQIVVSDDHSEAVIAELRDALWQIVNWSNNNPIAPPLEIRQNALTVLRKYSPLEEPK